MSRDKTKTAVLLILLCILTHEYYAMPNDETNPGGNLSKNQTSKTDNKPKPKFPNLITREEWGAAPPRIWPELVKLKHPVPFVVVSYFTPKITDDKMTLQLIQRKHQNAGQPDIQSNFLIGRGGKVYEGRGWDFQPAKSLVYKTYDGRFIEISYIGDFNNADIDNPVFRATWELLEFGMHLKYLDDNFKLLDSNDNFSSNFTKIK